MGKCTKKFIISSMTLVMMFTMVFSQFITNVVAEEGIFTISEPSEVPSFYSLLEEEKQLYEYINIEEETLYRVHGMVDADNEGFYLSDEAGEPIQPYT